MQCTIAGGDLPVHVSWLINGHEIADYLEVLLEKRGKKIHMLTIESVSEKHMGNYTCVAYNNAGHVNHTSELKVNGLIRLLNQCVLYLFFVKSFFLNVLYSASKNISIRL